MVKIMKTRPLAVMATLAVLAALAGPMGPMGPAGPAPLAAQGFGSSVSVGEDEVLVGEPTSEREPGSVRVFRAGDWAEVQALYAPDAAVRDRFGAALADDGSRLFVGAPGAGAVHVFERAGAEWRHAAEIPSPGLEEFGRVLAASGAHLLVAAADGSGGQDIVVAYRPADGGGWVEEARLTADRGPSGFGTSVALDRNLALIGAPLVGEGRGAAYLFRFEAGAGWDRVAQLGGDDGDAGRAFGSAVALVGDEALVGAAGEDEGLGAVHRFARNAEGEWQLAGTVGPGNPPPTAFGAALAVDGAVAWVGAPAAAGKGLVYRLERGGDGWTVDYAWDVTGPGWMQVGRVVAARGGRVVVGLPADDFGAGSAVVRDARSGRVVRLASEQVGLPGISGGQIDCEEGFAEGFDCDRVDLLSFLPREELGAGRGARLNDVWGWTDPETGREYALVGRMDGTAFVDVTDPFTPRYLGNLAKTEGSRSNTWRDMKVFRDHMFVVADGAGQHGMQIFDLTRLRDVTEPREWEPTALYEDVASVHNVAINEETGFAYLVGASGGGETCGGGSHIVDINDPLNPLFAGCFAHPNTGRRNTGNSHDTQCVIYHGPDEDYAGREICVNSNETALSIADVTDKSSPVAVARAEYPNVSYAHQGWFTEDHEYFYSNDEADEVNGSVEQTRTLVWDLRDLDDPLLVREYFSPTKVTDHNLYVRGDRLYMSNNRAGLRVLDISDPENPAEVGSFDTTPWSEDSAGFDGTWSVYPYFASGTILLSSRREGLFLVKPRAERLVP
ncbi:choice-of-anchor B family protein [Candidatus Palauibacter sp.]|uniref:choice-of-anchor B family protein n=1 Tax=Candidatus Palauibacter sp. TaxID=3101350 RepID=UPI003B5C5AAA